MGEMYWRERVDIFMIYSTVQKNKKHHKYTKIKYSRADSIVNYTRTQSRIKQSNLY